MGINTIADYKLQQKGKDTKTLLETEYANLKKKGLNIGNSITALSFRTDGPKKQVTLEKLTEQGSPINLRMDAIEKEYEELYGTEAMFAL